MELTTTHRLMCLSQLNRLVKQNPSIFAAAVVMRDGRPFAHTSIDKADDGKFAAMVSSTTILGETVMRELSDDVLDHVLIKGRSSTLVMIKVPDCQDLLILTLLATIDSLPGLILGQAKFCAHDIAHLVSNEQNAGTFITKDKYV